ncbi:hypothetical protein VPH35_110557 [Triticum aestivum]
MDADVPLHLLLLVPVLAFIPLIFFASRRLRPPESSGVARLPHQALRDLARRHGPLMLLRFPGRPGLRVSARRPHVAPLVPGLRGPRLRALRRRVAPAPQDLHSGAPQRPPRPLLPPRPPGRARPPPPCRRLVLAVAVRGSPGEPDRDYRGLHRRLHRACHHRQQAVQGRRRVPEAVRGHGPHEARAEPVGPVSIIAPRDARQPRARPDQALQPRDAADHGRRHPGAPGEESRR